MNYAFIVPTALVLAVALGLAIWLAATGSWIPLVLTVIAVIAALGIALV